MSKMKQTLRMMRWWPPFLGAGIRVISVDDQVRKVVVRMRLSWWNRNIVKVHFGGSLYAMTDPFYMLMLIHNLGKDYVIWDKAAEIRFLKPGKSTVFAEFFLTEERLSEIKMQVDELGKKDVSFIVLVKADTGEVVAEVKKVIYIRRKDYQPKRIQVK
ncbi:DUF4442 domain-containing protein [Penaeicola halotolerans]|uniref:DUF4442 domain-containing protein n=1 Tax=Penaeicola halotolerans TaxID=2793196 RepID=UPI001CF80425|nr:DUF4442 domain-containing protein [Penaeicola halotolerans]